MIRGAAGVSPAAARPSAHGPWVVTDLGGGRGVVAGHRLPAGEQTLRTLIRNWGRPAILELHREDRVATWRRPAAQAILRNLAGIPY